MARPPIPDVRITEALQPAAALVNIGFAHPAPPAPSPLHGVAQALESLSSDLMSWGRKEDARRKEEDEIRGEAQFYQQYGDGVAEGIRTDQIPANQSPEFVRGYKRAQGSAAGFPLTTTIENEYAASDIKTNTDPKAFNDWFREQIKNKVTTDDPSILRGLNPHLRQLHSNLHNRWQADVAQNTKYQAQTGYGALAASTIDAYNLEGLKNRTGTDVEKLGATLDQIRDKGFALGLKREEIDSVMVDAVTSKALQHRDPQLLKLLDRESAAGPKLSDTPYGNSKKLETVKTLTSLWKTQTTEERQQQERDDKLASNAAKAKIADRLIKDPSADISDEDIAPILKIDGNFKLDLLTWRKNVREGSVAEDPKLVQQVMEDLLRGKGEDAFWAAVTSGTIKTPETMARARSFMDLAAKANAAPAKILDTSTARSYVGNIEMLGQDSMFSKQSILGIKAMTEGGRAALNDYKAGLMKWQVEHPNASALEMEKFAAEYGETIIKGLRPVTSEYAQPLAVQQRVGDSPRALKPPKLSIDHLGLSVEDRQSFDREAAARGVTPQTMLDEIWDRATDKAPDITVQDLKSAITERLKPPTPEPQPEPPGIIERLWTRGRQMFQGRQPEEPAQGQPQATAAPSPQQQGQASPPTDIPSGAQKIYASPKPPAIDEIGLTPDERRKIEDFAASRNISAQEVIDRGWRRGQQMKNSSGGGEAVTPPAPAPESPRPEGPRSSLDLPGGLGQIQLVGVSPENLEAIRNAVASLNLSALPRMQQASLTTGDIQGAMQEVLSSKRISASIVAVALRIPCAEQ